MAVLASGVLLFLVATNAVAVLVRYGTSASSLSELLRQRGNKTAASWTGLYFPTPPPTRPPQPPSSRVPMGAINPNCDDAKTNLTVDWNFSPMTYSCFYNRQHYYPNFNLKAILDIETVPKLYSAAHYCMNETISYLNPLPTFGPHRPAWPRYGEYKFLPVQRWLHSMEHGGVVMLYHPCANHLEIEKLRRIVKSCLFRHVISSNQDLSAERPLALLTWGKRLTMSAVNVGLVKDFIQQNALQGPEKVSRDGQYDAKLIEAADIVSDTEDNDLCPEEKFKSFSF